MSDGKNGFSDFTEFDFKPIGMAIKKARESQGITREQLSEKIDYAPRHIQAIENEGQIPSLQLFIQLVTMFDISVDQYIFPNKKAEKSTARRQLDALLDTLSEKELLVVEATVIGLCKAKEFVKCNPVNCKLYTIDELSTIVDLQEQLKRKLDTINKIREGK